MALQMDIGTDWTDARDCLPPDGLVVETVISDADGWRNEQRLKRSGNLWFLADGSMYVYYRPTHWRFVRN
jgi:hypothetical protein